MPEVVLFPETVLILLFFALVIVLKSDTATLYIIFTAVFMLGILNFFDVPYIVVRSIKVYFILLLFLKALINESIIRKQPFITFGLKPILLFVLITVVSAIINNVSVIAYWSFIHIPIADYLLLLAVLNLKIPQKKIRSVIRYLVILFLIQIPAALVKLAIFRNVNTEGGGIGTIHMQEGSLSTILPMFAIGFVLSAYFYKKKTIYLFIVLGFVAFGIINSKRAIIFFIPLIYFIVQYLHTKRANANNFEFIRKNIFSKLALTVGLACITFYAIARINPTLNPDRKIGGRFDLNYIMNFSNDYTSASKDNNLLKMRRRYAPKYFYNLLNGKGLDKLMLGMGPGDVVRSRFLYPDQDPMLTKYGVRYAGRLGIIWFFMQVGLIGLFFYFYFHFRLGKMIWSLYKKNPSIQYQIIALGFIMAIFTFFIDNLIYSTSMLKSGALMTTYYYIAALLIGKQYRGVFEPRYENDEQKLNF